jgi:hypothetical protein
MLPPPRRVLPLFATLSTLPLNDSSRVLGQLCLGAPGVGKTILLSLLLLVDLLRGLPGCVLDPLGTLSEAFLFRLACFLSEFPAVDDELLRQRLRYIELGGDSVTSFPIYYQRHGESLFDAGNRLITVLERANPQLATSPLTWPAARRLALNAGMLFTALGYGGLTEIESLLFQTINWHQSGKFDEAIRRNPQAADAVSYFRNFYLLLPRSEQRRLAGAFLDQVYPLLADPKLRAIFSGPTNCPGIAWEEEVEANPQLVMINCNGLTDPASRHFALHWIVESLSGHLKIRGRRNTPFVVTIDEFANLAASGTPDNKPLTDFFDELLAQYARNNQVFVTAALQSLDQVDQRLQQTLLRLGTITTGRAGSLREARALADQLFRKDIYRIHHHKKVWGKVDPPRFIPGVGYYPDESLSVDKQRSPYYPYYILEYDPQYMGLDLQAEDAAGRIQQLGALEFLSRSAGREDEGGGDVARLFIADAISDADSGQWQFPDPETDAALISRIQQQLAARSGIPMEEIVREQERKSDFQTRLATGTLEPPSKPQPAAEVNERQPAQLPAGTQPAPRSVKETPSHPTLDEHQQALLAFIIEQQETPISEVYKRLSLSWRTGNQLRDSLTKQGYIAEIETRAGKSADPRRFFFPPSQPLRFSGKSRHPAGVVWFTAISSRWLQRAAVPKGTA